MSANRNSRKSGANSVAIQSLESRLLFSADHLVFTTEPTTTSAGTADPVVVSVENSSGSVDTTVSGTATLTLAGGATVGSGGTFANGDNGSTVTATITNGVATFSNVIINRVGTGYTLAATDSNSDTTATSTSFNVTASSSTASTFTTEPTSSVAAGANAGPVVVALTTASGTGTVKNGTAAKLEVENSSGKVVKTYTANAKTGVATFKNVKENTAGTYTLVLKASKKVATGTSSAFTITAGAADKLAFTTQPSSAVAGASFDTAVSIEDKYGNVVLTDSTDTVTLALPKSKSADTLSGTLTETASSGVATFSGLSINNPGTYTLLASSSVAKKPAKSKSFKISAS